MSGGASATDLDEIMRKFKQVKVATGSSATAAAATSAAVTGGWAVPPASASALPPAADSDSAAPLTLEQILQQGKRSNSAAAAVSSAPSSNDVIVAASPLPLDEFLSLINRQLAILLDGASTAPARKASFESLKLALGSPTLPLSHAIHAYKIALKPLLKRFGDEREWCRENAIQLVTQAVNVLPDLTDYLHFILPVLAYRMGTIDLSDAPVTLGANTSMHERSSANPNDGTAQLNGPARVAVSTSAAAAQAKAATAEQSSAIRTLLLRLLHELMLRCSNRELEIYLPDVCQILYSSLQTDRGPELKMLVCDSLKVLCEDYPGPMRAFSRILMLPLMQRVLLDKSSSVRLRAVRAVATLIPCGAAEQIRDLCAFREHNVIDIHGFFHGEHNVHYLARLVADTNRGVRAEFFRMVNAWSLTLYERADYETLIMPYVFSGLSDPDSEIQRMGIETMTVAGREFEREEKERLASGVGGNAMDEGAFKLKLLAEESSRQYIAKLGPPLLFAPFTVRPPWGERQIARKFLDRLLHAVLTEKGDWQRDVAEKSWTLLRVLLVYAEEHITQFSGQLLKAFHTELLASHQRHEKPFQAMWDCIALVGCYTDPSILLAAMATEIRATGGEKLRAAVRVAAHAIKFMPHTHTAFLRGLDEFVTSMLEPGLYLTVEPELFHALVELVSSILSRTVSHGFLAKHGQRFFQTVLEMAAWSRTTFRSITTESKTALRTAIDACFQELRVCVMKSMDDDEPPEAIFLFQLHLLPIVLEWRDQAIDEWTDHTLQFGMLLEILERVGTAGLFVSPAASADSAPSSPLTIAQQISTQLETILLRVLTSNSHLTVHAALLGSLVAPLQASSAAASASTDVSCSFSRTFLFDVRRLITERVADFQTRFPSTVATSSSLARASRQEEIALEAAERARLAQRELIRQHQEAARLCLDAIKD